MRTAYTLCALHSRARVAPCWTRTRVMPRAIIQLVILVTALLLGVIAQGDSDSENEATSPAEKRARVDFGAFTALPARDFLTVASLYRATCYLPAHSIDARRYRHRLHRRFPGHHARRQLHCSAGGRCADIRRRSLALARQLKVDPDNFDTHAPPLALQCRPTSL